MSSKVINTILNLKDNFSKTLKGVANNTKTFQKQLREASSAANKMQNSFNNAFSGLKTAAAVAGVGSLTAIATSSVKTYATFEQSMSKVQALSGATGEDLRQLTEKAKEMGSKTSKSASESADALGYMALAGWNTKQMMTGLEPILRASEAGEMDLATCSDLVTDSMSAMGIQVEDLNHYLDVCTKTQSSSNTSMQGLLEAYVLCGGTMKNLNVSVEESATVLGTLANRGKKGAEAGNALNSILVNLTGGSSTAKGAMSELGVSAWDSQGKFIGLKATLVKLRDALSKCTDEQKTNFESAIGGKTQLDTLQAMISGVSEEYDDLNAKLNDCDGYMTQAAKTMQDNLIGKLTALKSAFEGVQIQIGERLEPSLSVLMENVTASLPAIGDMVGNVLDTIVSNIPSVINFLNNMLPLILGILAGFKGFIIVTRIVSLYTRLKKAIQGVTIVQALLNSTMLANPITWVAIAIGVLVTALVLAYQHSESFRNTVSNLWTKIQEVGAGIMAWVTSTILPIISQIATSLSNFWNGVLSPFLSWCLGVLAPIFGGVWTTICQFVVGAFTSIGEIISGGLQIFQGVIDFLTGVFTGNWQLAWDGITEIVSGVIDTITGLWDGLVSLLSTPINAAINITKNIFGGDDSSAPDQNALGTNNFSGGYTWVGEHGPELMKLPQGTQIKTNNESKNMVNNNNSSPIQVIIQGNVIGNESFADYIGEVIFNKIQLASVNME